ncbi:protein MNN4-like [Mugil cephalus]|uniref:protein MNN4-like n=1 Tax=Mugil cephalus TaxID=48193 RepID=UPI001FB79A03|nr:protein MNN4-like [Mugil cephalus]
MKPQQLVGDHLSLRTTKKEPNRDPEGEAQDPGKGKQDHGNADQHRTRQRNPKIRTQLSGACGLPHTSSSHQVTIWRQIRSDNGGKKLDVIDSEYEEDIQEQLLLCETQEDPPKGAGDATRTPQSEKKKKKKDKVNDKKGGDATHNPQSEKRKKKKDKVNDKKASDANHTTQSEKRMKKKKDKDHRKRVNKSEMNVGDGRKVSREKWKNTHQLQAGREKSPPKKLQPLPEIIDTHGRRRVLNFTPEFLAMVRLVFQEDIEKKTITKKRVRDVVNENPAVLRICNKMELSVENIRNRIRMMIKQE